MNLVASTAARLNWRRWTLTWRSSLYVNSYYLMAANVVTAAFGFLYWTAAARLYPPGEVGLAAAAISAVGLVSMLSTLGMDYAMVRFLPHAADPAGIINSSLTVGAVAALVLSAVFLAGLGLWSPALLPLRENVLLAFSVVGAAVFTTISSLLAGAYMARKRAGLVLAQASVFSVTKVLLAAGLSAVAGASGLIGAWTLGLALAAAGGIAVFLPRAEERRHGFRVMLRREVVNEMTRFAFANYVSALLWSGPGLVLPLLVINLMGPATNAHFYIAWSVGGLLVMVPAAVSLTLFAHGSHDDRRLAQHTLDSGRFALVLLVPAIAAVFLLGNKVLLLFGSSYSQEGAQLLRILALTTLPMTVNFLFFSVRRVQQRMGSVVLSAAWILAVTLGLSAVLLPRLGLLGAGVAWFAAQTSVALVLLARYALSRRADGRRDDRVVE